MKICQRCQHLLNDDASFCSKCGLAVQIKPRSANSSLQLPLHLLAGLRGLVAFLEDSYITEDLCTLKVKMSECQQKIDYLYYLTVNQQGNISPLLESFQSRLREVRKEVQKRERAAFQFSHDLDLLNVWVLHLENCPPRCSSETLWEGMNRCLPEIERVLREAVQYGLYTDTFRPRVIDLRTRLIKVDQMIQEKRHKEILSKRPLWKTVVGYLFSALSILAYWVGLPAGVGSTLSTTANRFLDYKEPPLLPPGRRY